MTDAILSLENLTVSFDGFKALDALTLRVGAGELRCIIGPNGAGKTTMMDVITGKTRPDAGSAWFGQTLDLLSLNEPEIARAGIGRKFQKPTVFGEHTVYENLQLAGFDVERQRVQRLEAVEADGQLLEVEDVRSERHAGRTPRRRRDGNQVAGRRPTRPRGRSSVTRMKRAPKA